MSVDRHRYRWRGITYPSLRLDGCVVRIDVGTILNIRNPRAHELAKELAERRKTGITEVVIQALEHELERERATIPLAQRLAAIAERGMSEAGPNSQPFTEADRDAMWTR